MEFLKTIVQLITEQSETSNNVGSRLRSFGRGYLNEG